MGAAISIHPGGIAGDPRPQNPPNFSESLKQVEINPQTIPQQQTLPPPPPPPPTHGNDFLLLK